MSHQRVDADSRRAQQVVPDSIIHRFHFKTIHGAFEQRLQKSTRLYTDLPQILRSLERTFNNGRLAINLRQGDEHTHSWRIPLSFDNNMAATPTETTERLQGLDVLRGFALYGVFLTNAMVSSRPLEEAIAPPDLQNVADASQRISETIAWAIFDGLLVTKFVAIFSLLFGMGLVLQNERAETKGQPFAPIYRRRLTILAVIGLLHGCLLFEGDILLVYSIVGAVLFCFRNLSPRALFGMSLFPLTLGLFLALAWALLEHLDQASEYAESDAWFKSMLPSATFLEMLTIRPMDFLGWLFFSSLMSFNCRVVAFFFMGAAIMKCGWIKPQFVNWQRNVGLACLAIGLTMEGLSVYWTLSIESPSLGLSLLRTMLDELGSVILSFGYMGIVLWIVHRNLLTRLTRCLAAVGRTALTNYLLQSVILNVVFMAFGLGLHHQLSRVQVLAWFSLIFVAQIIISTLWLSYFKMGPIEKLWRSQTYRGVTKTERSS